MKCEESFAHRLYRNEEDSFYSIEVFKILTCLNCRLATVVLYSSIGLDEESEQSIDLEEIVERPYQRTVLYGPTKQFHPAIPHSIAEVAKQAEAVLEYSPRANFILCRAILEEVCNNFNIPIKNINSKGKSYFLNLHDRLLQLFEKERMPQDLQAIIQGIKDLGNEGAHSDHLTFVRQVKVQDAKQLFNLVNYVLEFLYVDRWRREEAKKTLNTLKNKLFSPEV